MKMNIKLIKSDSDYQAALNRLEDLFHAPPGTPENEELEILQSIRFSCYKILKRQIRQIHIPPRQDQPCLLAGK